MIRAAIAGSSGYVAGELIRCLVHHPGASIDSLFSRSESGQKVSDIHKDLFACQDLVFTGDISPDADVVFLCMGHGDSTGFLSENSFSADTKIIDLSHDFRLRASSQFGDKSFVYGLPELNKEKIASSSYIANPGCFATAILLGLLPLARSGLLHGDVHIHGITGSTGAGRQHSPTTHFSWRDNNISIYKPFEHQHLAEITESIASLQQGFAGEINFLPVRGDFTRGIFATMYTKCSLPEEKLVDIYEEFYRDEAFTHISKSGINLKQVINTNNCLIQVQRIGGRVLITSVIDNLLKGAAGAAIQNMNLMLGLPETMGLNFKASSF